MPKNQKSRKGRRPSKRRSSRSLQDPSFTHVLTYTYYTAVSTPTAGVFNSVYFGLLSGFPQLATFFEMYQPVMYRMLISYTNWTGTAAFVPQSPLSYDIPSTISQVDTSALKEVRGSVRVQPGYSNTGSWSSYPYAQQGFQTYGAANSNVDAGYLVFYNDAPTVANWTVQMSLEIRVRFFRRTLFYFAITPTLYVKPSPKGGPDESGDTSLTISTMKY